MLRDFYIRVLNGLAIRYSFGDLLKYLHFQFKKYDVTGIKKINLEGFIIRNVVISLNFREDRRLSIDKQFKNLEIPFHFFDAIHGETEKIRITEAVNLSHFSAKYLTPGSLGCMASHMSLWKELVESYYDSYLVFEDDVIVNKNQRQIEAFIGKSGDTDHHNPVQTDHPKLTSFSCDKKVVFHC